MSQIGLFSLVAIPSSIKFLWSPLLDRSVPLFLGRRRGWLFRCQLGRLIAIAAHTDWPTFFLLTLVAAFPAMGLLPFFAPWTMQKREAKA